MALAKDYQLTVPCYCPKCSYWTVGVLFQGKVYFQCPSCNKVFHGSLKGGHYV